MRKNPVLNLRYAAWPLAISAWSLACGGETGTNSPSSIGDQSANDDERGSVGVPGPGYYPYCIARGGTSDGVAECHFSDGTTCELGAFYLGECGQSHSYCEEMGGSLTIEMRNMGSQNARVPICTLDGHTCIEHEFMKTGVCEE